MTTKCGSVDREIVARYNDSFLTANENTVEDQIFERCFNGIIYEQKGHTVDKIEDIIFTAIDKIITPSFELVVKSKNASSGRDAASVTENSECG